MSTDGFVERFETALCQTDPEAAQRRVLALDRAIREWDEAHPNGWDEEVWEQRKKLLAAKAKAVEASLVAQGLRESLQDD